MAAKGRVGYLGQRDAGVPIDMYLDPKQKVPGEELKRSSHLRYCHTGRHETVIAEPPLILVFVFAQIAEYVPSLLSRKRLQFR